MIPYAPFDPFRETEGIWTGFLDRPTVTDAAEVQPTPPPPPVVNYDALRAEYGGVIPISMGTRRMPGQVVWASPVYGEFPDVYVDLGVSYGYNGDSDPSETEISRIWADGALIWRAGEGILPGLDYISDNGWKVYNYTGTDDQTVNPLYESDVGEANATAFRGQLLSFFRRLPLKEFNYQLPGISAEIAGAVSETPSATITDYVIVRANWTGVSGATENYLRARLFIFATEGALDGTQASNTGGGAPPYIAAGGFHVSADLEANEVAAFYVDLGAIRAAFPTLESIDLDLRTNWTQYGGGSDTVQWSFATWVGDTPPSASGIDFAGNGVELDEEAGSYTQSGTISTVRTFVLRDTASGGSVIDAPDSITVQAFLERAAEYAGLDPETDLSFGDGTDDTIAGGLLHEEETFGSLAQRVVRYAGWEMFEADTIKFVKPVGSGGSYTVDATIPAADLLDQGDRAITTHRRPDSDTPLHMALSYIDSTQQYKYNTQRARRILYPTRSTQSRRKDGFAVPFVITASEALTRAAQAMFREVNQNVAHTFDLPPEYIYLEPGDIIDITAGDTSYEVKITKIEIGANLALRVTVVNLMTDDDIELEASSGTPLDPYRGEPLPIITGTMAATDGADDFDAGDQINNANFTDGADGFSASGTVSTTGTMAATEGADEFSATGSENTSEALLSLGSGLNINSTLSNGGRSLARTGSFTGKARTQGGVSAGVYYVEAALNANNTAYLGVCDSTFAIGTAANVPGVATNSIAISATDGAIKRNNTTVETLTSWGTGRVCMELDADAETVRFRIAGGSWSSAHDISSFGSEFFMLAGTGSASVLTVYTADEDWSHSAGSALPWPNGRPGFTGWGTTTGAANSLTVNVPYPTVGGSTQLDDILVLIVHSDVVASTYSATGFTSFAAELDNGSTMSSQLFWKRADGTETGTLTVNQTSAGGASDCFAGTLLRFNGCVASGTPFEVLQSAARASASTFTGLTVTATGDDRLGVTAIALGNDGMVLDDDGGNWTTLHGGGTYQTSAGTDGAHGAFMANVTSGVAFTAMQENAMGVVVEGNVYSFALLPRT